MQKTKITNPFVPLTISGEATRNNILTNYGKIRWYAQHRRLSDSTLGQILAGKYPCPSNHKKSRYQQTLIRLHKDGLLVQADQQPE